MAVVDVDQAHNYLSEMIDRVQDGERITITSRNCNAVLISEEDYNSLVETIHLLSDPHMTSDLDRTRGTPLTEMEVWTQRCRTGRPGRTARPRSEAPSSNLWEKVRIILCGIAETVDISDMI